MYITSADLNSNGLMIYNDSAATVNINVNIQNVRVLSTGATLNNRGIVFNNNNTTKTIAGNVTNCNLTAYASTGVTDIALYVNSTTTFNVTVNAYNSLFSGADSDVTVISTNSCTLTNCTLVNGTVTGTVVYGGTQSAKQLKFGGNTPAAGMTSQLLNWYEEGTWTPIYDSSGASFTYTEQYGWYVRIGALVTIQCRIKAATATGTTSNSLRVGGLPFATGSLNALSSTPGSIGLSTFPIALAATSNDASSIITLWQEGTTSQPIALNAVGAFFTLSMTYRAA